MKQQPNLRNALDRVEAMMYTCTIKGHKVVESGETDKCSTGSMNTALTAKAVSSFPPNSERFSKKIMWNDFTSLEVWIRVSLYSQKMNGRNKSPDSKRSPLQVRRPGSLTGSIFQGPVR